MLLLLLMALYDEVGYSPTNVRLYKDNELVQKREATQEEKALYKTILPALREARALRLPPERLRAEVLVKLASTTRQRELRPAQWTIGNCYNLDHWPAITATVPAYDRLGKSLSSPLLVKGSYYCVTRRCWIIPHNAPPINFKQPKVVVAGSVSSDDRKWLPPRTQNRLRAYLIWQQLSSSLD